MLPEDLNSLKVVDLKEELKKRDQPVAGKKADLVARLQAYIAEHEAGSKAPEDAGAAAAKPDDAPAEVEPVAEAEPDAEPQAAPEAVAAAAAPPSEQAQPAPEAAPAAAAGEDEGVDYGDSEPDEPAAAAPAAQEQAAAAEPAQPAPEVEPEAEPAARKDEAARSAAPATAAQSKMFGAALGALRQAGGDGSARKRGAGAAPASAPAKLQRGAGGRDVPAPAASPAQAPPPQGPPTRALHIDGFVRPFTLNQARDLLSQSGTVLSVWLPTIKNYCYAVFATKEGAEAARSALWQAQWPAGSPKRLAPRFVSLREAEAAIGTGGGNPDFRIERIPEDGPEEEEEEPAAAAAMEEEAAAAAPNPAAAAGATAGAPAQAPAAGRSAEKAVAPNAGVEVQDLRALLSRPRPGGEAPRAERAVAVPAAARPAPVADAPLSLDDLFRKTAAKPAIYWLPLTDEQVAQKRGGGSSAGNGAAA